MCLTYIKIFKFWHIRSIIDVIAALTNSQNPLNDWYCIKQLEKISGIELSTNCRQSGARDLEKKSGKRDASQENYKSQLEAVARKRLKNKET